MQADPTKRVCSHFQGPLVLFVVCVLFVSCARSEPTREGFAIYLTREDIPPAQMPALSHVDIAEQPIIVMDDVIAYDPATHEIELTPDAYHRVSSLEVPVKGRSFLVCVDRNPIYWGAFWTPISSISFDGVTIYEPTGSQDPNTIRLELGYPSSLFHREEDPRGSPEVLESLQNAGKLNEVSPATTVGKLPHSFKGYELYSWSEDDQWHFTLTAGTNRIKTLEEVTADTDAVGLVHAHMIGLEAIKAVLCRLPQDEHVMWPGRFHPEQTPDDSVHITLPTEPIVEAIKEHANRCALELAIVPTDSYTTGHMQDQSN